MKNKERLSFEEALSRLEEIVEKLEDESISLDESIELYEEGMKLSQRCTETLEEAELRIEKVNQQHEENENND